MPSLPDLRIVADADQLSQAAADLLCSCVESTLRDGDRCAIALSGGSTPRRLYGMLGQEPWRGRIDWLRLHAFIVDERFVPPDHADSNERMIRETLMATSPLPDTNLHPIPYMPDGPEAAAARYEEELRRFFGSAEPPRFDLILLGMGADGHTASLFPGTSAPEVADRLVIPSVNPAAGAQRVTLTLPVLNAAAAAAFLVAGADKAETLRAVLEERRPSFPAALVRPAGRLTWLVDEAAASRLERRPG